MFMRFGAAEFGALPTAAARVSIGALFLFPLMMLRGQGAALVQHWKPSKSLGDINSGLPFALFIVAAVFALLYLAVTGCGGRVFFDREPHMDYQPTCMGRTWNSHSGKRY